MQDLNDLFYFAQVVAHGGFAPAGRALRQPKSKLSRRVAQLEERLGVKLIERSSRRFRVTELGQAFYERCSNILNEAEEAEAIVAEARGEARGVVRVSVPNALLETALAEVLADFTEKFPDVELRLIASNRRVDLIEERVDVAFRVRDSLDTDATLIVKALGMADAVLVASPTLMETLGPDFTVEQLKDVPLLSIKGEELDTIRWHLSGPDDEARMLEVSPRLASSDISMVRQCALRGQGIALLPRFSAHHAIQAGKLVRVLPEWRSVGGIIHILFKARRGLPPAVRALIDHLSDRARGKTLWECDRASERLCPQYQCEEARAKAAMEKMASQAIAQTAEKVAATPAKPATV